MNRIMVDVPADAGKGVNVIEPKDAVEFYKVIDLNHYLSFE